MTSRAVPENRPEVLWRLVSGLWAALEQGRRDLTVGQFEAVVEACFRIGVHPATDPATALTMLTRAHRLDGTNPKHPYHVGLLYLRHGRPAAALPWFTAAADLSPANHRVWAHLSLAHRALDGQDQDDQGDSAESHGERARTIADKIREGAHDFAPAGADAPASLPLLRPEKCRWTGIHDMAADARLHGNTTKGTRDELACELEGIVELADRRRGGTAAFAVLAVQWMVYGYPTVTVRRLAKKLPPDDGPATRMLHLVCDLFETDLAELPARLADCLAERSLPDVLIALIHRRRLFWRPLAFPDLGAHAAAREFAEGDHEKHEKALRMAAERLDPAPPEPLEDAPSCASTDPTAPHAQGPDEALAAFEASAAALTDLVKDVHTHIKSLTSATVADAAGYARISGDRDVLTDLVKRLEPLQQARLEEMQQFEKTEPSGLVMAFEEFQRRTEECKASFQAPLGSLRKILSRTVGKELAAKAQDFPPTTPAPTDQALALEHRLAALEQPPDAPDSDSPVPGSPTPDDRLAEFERAAAQVTGLVSDTLAHAKSLVDAVVNHETDYARVVGDRSVLTDLVNRLEAVRQGRLKSLQELKKPEASESGLVMAFEEFQRRTEECEAAFQAPLGSLRIILNKVRKQLATKQGEFATVAPTPSEPALALAERLSDLEEHTPDLAEQPPRTTDAAAPPADRRPALPPPPARATPRERVEHALAAAEHHLDANFEEAWQTLDAYPAGLRNREAVVLLRTWLGGQQAEAELRLGRTTAARRRWNAMLTDAPSDPAVLRNLAVAHTSAGDLAQAAQAWNRYLEALYLQAVLDGDLRRGAAERAELHRVLAASFGTAPLCPRPTDDRDPDKARGQVVPVLAGSAKVAIAVAHLRLEELNHALSHRSATLLLGIDRNIKDADADAALGAARDRRRAAFETALPLLPSRIRASFGKLCRERIDEAYREASRTQGRTRKPGDEAEEAAHLEWARGRLRWKMQLVEAVRGEDPEWPLAEHSGDVIAGLSRIDTLALDPTDEALRVSAQQMRLPGDPTKHIEGYNQLTEFFCDFALGQIYAAAEEAAPGPATRHFADRFRRAARSWGRNSDIIARPYADLLDDPQRLYYASVESAFGILKELTRSGRPADDRERGILSAAATALERWVERLPGATGPARTLATVLAALDRYDEARTVLSRARREAFSETGRRHVALATVRLDITGERFTEAVDLVRELLDDDSYDEEQLRDLLTDAYNRWINSGKEAPDASAITEDFARWTDPDTVRNRRLLVVAAALTKDRSRLDPMAAARDLAEDLVRLSEQDPDNVEARYHLVVALYQQALAVRKQMQSTADTARALLRRQLGDVVPVCAERASDLLDSVALTDEERLENIREILRAVRPEDKG